MSANGMCQATVAGLPACDKPAEPAYFCAGCWDLFLDRERVLVRQGSNHDARVHRQKIVDQLARR